MVTYVDVLAVVATLIGVSLSTWAILMATALLFNNKTANAQANLRRSPWKTTIVGLLITLVAGTIGIGFVAAANPGVKLVGWVLLMGLVSVAMVGGSGVSAIVGERIQALAPNMTPYQSLTRGSAIVVLSFVLPIFGWFVLAPLCLCASVGAGVSAVLVRAKPPVIRQEA